MLEKKHILAIDMILIVGTAIALLGIIGYTKPLVIAPIDELQTTNTSILFEFEKGNIILIDDNPYFTSPEKILAENNLVINLKPGKYYWKVQGAFSRESEVRELTILSEIELKLKKTADGYAVVNAGNVELNVEIYNNNTLSETVVLAVDETAEVSGTKFVGRQNEQRNT